MKCRWLVPISVFLTSWILLLSLFSLAGSTGSKRSGSAQAALLEERVAEPSAPQSSAVSFGDAFISAPGIEGQWVLECVDYPKQFSHLTDRSLQLDADGHPHIAYGGENLYYAWYDGAWHYEVVDHTSNVGVHAALALDGDGYPHISYGDLTNNDLKYASILPVIPAGVFIHGAQAGLPGIVYPFTAAVTPFSPTLPITYVWGAVDQLPVTHTGGLRRSVTFTWSTTGTKVITVSAHHISVTLTDTRSIIIVEPKVFLPFVAYGQADFGDGPANPPASPAPVTMPILAPAVVLMLITYVVGGKGLRQRRED